MLSDALWRARRLLTASDGEETLLLDIRGNAVAFRPVSDTFVDVFAFERLLGPLAASLDTASETRLGADTVARMREATALSRGDFLEDCYDDWTLYERERLRELYLGALRRLLAHDLATRAHDAGLQIALQLVRADPLREEAHRDLMRLYYLLGREADALRAYEQCVKVLDEELGVEPDPATINLYEEIRSLQQRRAWEQARGPIAPVLSDPPLVGRPEQRAELMDIVEQAIAGAGGALLVVGEAGLGKTRMLREVASGAEWRGAQVSWGYGREDAQARPFGPLRGALTTALIPAYARQLTDLVSQYALGLLALLLPELAEALPAAALQQAQPSERQAAALHVAIREAVLALGQIAPQVILLEDIHWFDSATLQTLAAVLPALRDTRVLLVISGRGDELAQRQEVWDTLMQLDRSGLLRRIDLRALDEAECTDLIRRVLRMRQPAPRFSARLYQATGGHPFFILQALRSLQEQGLLKRDERGVWHTSWDTPGGDYHDLPLPAGLRDAIDARLRGLQPHEREALAAAAVLGQNFAPAVWAGMADNRRTTNDERQTAVGRSTDSETRTQENQQRNALRSQSAAPPAPLSSEWPAVVDRLLKRQFLVEEGASLRFGHDTLREAIYGELDQGTRQSLHLRAAEALEREHYARVEALAQHLYLAGAWDKALPYLIQAGERASAVYAWHDALRSYEQALQAATQAGPEAADLPMRWAIQLNRGAAAVPLGDYPLAIAAYEDVLRLAEQDERAPDAPTRADERRGAQIQALNGLIYIYGQRNDYERAREAVGRAMALAEDSPRLIDRAEVFYQAGLISFRTDDHAEARRYLAEALHLYKALGLELEQAKCFSMTGWSHLRQDGPTDRVIEFYSRALDMYRKQGNRLGEHSCLIDIANARLVRGQLGEVVREVEPCLLFFRSIGAQDSVAESLFLLGEAYRRTGRLTEAMSSLRDSLEILTHLDRTAAAAFNRVAIAATLRDMARYNEALAELSHASQVGDRMIRARALLVLSDIARHTNDIGAAWKYLAEAITLAGLIGSKAYRGIAYRLLAQLRGADTRQQLPSPQPEMPDIDTCFAESLRLLQEAHCDDELALTYHAYGQYLIIARRPSQALEALTQARMLMHSCGMAGKLQSVAELIAKLQTLPAALGPGQRRVMLARKGVPRGRPLRSDEMIEVIWTIDPPEQRIYGQPASKTAERQERLRRLCEEAAAQGAEPTVGDLAGALGVTARTIDRDIAALRAAGEVLATRGSSG
jgi:DNA-binding SARP family transcriptional activator